MRKGKYYDEKIKEREIIFISYIKKKTIERKPFYWWLCKTNMIYKRIISIKANRM